LTRPSTPSIAVPASPPSAEPGLLVDADLYQLKITSDVVPAAEIDEIAWLKPGDETHLTLAPLTRDHVLPNVGWGAPSHPTNERPA